MRPAVAQEIGSVAKELALELGPSGFEKIGQTTLAAIRAVGFEILDMVALGGELLTLPKNLVNVLGPAR